MAPRVLAADIEMLGGTESTPLLAGSAGVDQQQQPTPPLTFRERVYEFLEARTPRGRVYEKFTAILILINVLAFICGTMFVEKYNSAWWAQRKGGICNNLCDAWLFGNYADNGLQSLQLGSTSILEIFTVAVFSIDYLLRVWCADLENPKFKGFWGRIRYLPTFYSLVDLASTVPFYVDAMLPSQDFFASQFLRMFRLFRMMRVEGRYDTALTMFDDVFYAQRGILGTALFVGVTTWMTTSALYYLVERRNLDMVYCGTAPDYCGDPDDINTADCIIDSWGFTNCTNAGCPSTDEYPEPCYNLYKSIPMASYYTLLNLFGEFPLIDQHGLGGKIVGTATAVIAVAVFALPAGIIGNGFETLIERKRQQSGPIVDVDELPPEPEENPLTIGFIATDTTRRGRVYNFLQAQVSYGSHTFDMFINVIIVGTTLSFMMDTLAGLPPTVHALLDVFELFAVVVFTVEYVLRVYSCKEDPKYQGRGGRWKYMCTFLAVVDILSVLPYWVDVAVTGTFVTPYSDSASTGATLVKCLRLLRLLRFEKYTHAFTSFDDVIRNNLDILAVTVYTALLYWVFFGAILYFTERDSRDEEMAQNYNNVPNSMWVTLLNLSGESPLSQYSVWGKIITGILGLAATGIFGIPIGVLGAGFEEVVEEETNETDADEADQIEVIDNEGYLNGSPSPSATHFEATCYKFVNGIGSKAATIFETSIYVLIFVSVAVGIWQTVDGHEDSFESLEWLAVIVFSIEYIIRFIGVPADPYFSKWHPNIVARLRYMVSFYSIIDLLAIVPFYIAVMMPNSWINKYDEYLRMLRLLRLVKLDKYVPSITLIDDVIRLKRKALKVACFAAGTLLILFSSLLYLTEREDDWNEIDPVPEYGCSEDCTMMDRFQNFFDSMSYTSVHLTGDYPIITYSWPARFVNFFMVIAAVGVVSVPSGLVANGFTTICQSRAKRRRGETPRGRAGDDWYELRLSELQGTDPPRSRFGPRVDKWQTAVNEFLNGKEDENGVNKYSPAGYACRIFMFVVIILNVIAVLAESVPSIDKYVGNEKGNFFDRFEKFSVSVFLAEYILRLFSAPKNLEALYSTFVYATTFFGIVDLLSTAPWFIQQLLVATGVIAADDDTAKIFRIFRIFRILQLEDFVTAFSKLDNVFRASKDVLKATGLMAIIVWVGCAALFYIVEENNPNWRSCDESIEPHTDDPDAPGCYDFNSTAACNDVYPGMCQQAAFTNMLNTLYYVAVFLGGEWGVIDFTWPGRFVCAFLCVAGIGLYSIPIGTLFDSFGAVLGMSEDEEEEGEDEEGVEK